MKQQKFDPRLIAATAAVFLGQSLYMFYVTARSVVLPTVLTELNGMSFYSITVILGSMMMAVSTPVAGKLGDMFGRKRVFNLGFITYAAALVLCAAAPNVYLLMLGIALSGMSYGLVYAEITALLVDIYPPDQSPKILGYTMVASSVAQLLGPVVGGLCVDYVSWRLVFLLMIPFSLLAAFCGHFGIPEGAPAPAGQRVDYAGTFLFAAAVMPFLFLLTSGGSRFAWLSPATAILAGVSLTALLLMLAAERRAENPVMPLPLLKKPIYLLALAVTLCGGLCYSCINYLPVYYQQVRGMSSTLSGLVVAPRQAGMMISSVLIGSYLSRHKNFKVATAVPVAMFAVAIGLMSRFNAVTVLVLIVAAELLFGLADGAIMVSPNAMGQHYLSHEQLGSGLSFISFVSTFGNSLGAAVIGCIVNQIQQGGTLQQALNTAFTAVFFVLAAVLVLLLVFPWKKHAPASQAQ